MNARLSHRRSQRGVSLIEAAIALVIMACGMLSIVGVQSSLRLNGDVARQRTEANRLAQAELEKLRAFTAVPVTANQLSWASLTSQAQTTAAALAGVNTDFRITRTVSTQMNPPLKIVTVSVAWVDRSGVTSQVTLESNLAAAEPILSGLLGFAATVTSASAGANGRNRTIPIGAKDLGDGTSVLKPTDGSAVAWVFNNSTGMITRTCTVSTSSPSNSLVVDDVRVCDNNDLAQLVTGVVRFNMSNNHTLVAADADPANASDPQFNLDVAINLTSTGQSRAAQCFDDAPTVYSGRALNSFITYYCVIYVNTSKTWSGMTYIVPKAFTDSGHTGNWEIDNSNDRDKYRICRYTPAASDSVTPAIANTDHPRSYKDVSGNLLFQNFLVIRAGDDHDRKLFCPTDVPADPTILDFVDTNTLLHQNTNQSPPPTDLTP
jgi:Tfp pilus assembly protein PilV